MKKKNYLEQCKVLRRGKKYKVTFTIYLESKTETLATFVLEIEKITPEVVNLVNFTTGLIIFTISE